MRILLTNDDGVQAPGIVAARAALSRLGEVWVVAPERPRSAAGHSITLHKPLRIHRVALPDGAPAYATNGTPTDCVSLGFDILLEGRCDLVVSGINRGSNLGWDLTYSGTVAAAIEGVVLGMQAFAISVTARRGEESVDFGPAAEFAASLAERIMADPLPPATLLNVNVPGIPADRLQGVSITHQGRTEYVDRIDSRTDPVGRPYYWLAGNIREDTPDPGSDVHAVVQDRISITPIQLDVTAYALMDRLREWPLVVPHTAK
jgi:5'-nucleotidase